MSGASRSPRRAARRQLFQAEDVCLESGWRGLCTRHADSFVFVRLYLSTLCRLTHLLAHPNLALPAWFRYVVRGEKASGGGGGSQVLFWFLDLRKDFYNPPGFFSFTGILGTF